MLRYQFFLCCPLFAIISPFLQFLLPEFLFSFMLPERAVRGFADWILKSRNAPGCCNFVLRLKWCGAHFATNRTRWRVSKEKLGFRYGFKMVNIELEDSSCWTGGFKVRGFADWIFQSWNAPLVAILSWVWCVVCCSSCKWGKWVWYATDILPFSSSRMLIFLLLLFRQFGCTGWRYWLATKTMKCEQGKVSFSLWLWNGKYWTVAFKFVEHYSWACSKRICELNSRVLECSCCCDFILRLRWCGAHFASLVCQWGRY